MLAKLQTWLPAARKSSIIDLKIQIWYSLINFDSVWAIVHVKHYGAAINSLSCIDLKCFFFCAHTSSYRKPYMKNTSKLLNTFQGIFRYVVLVVIQELAAGRAIVHFILDSVEPAASPWGANMSFNFGIIPKGYNSLCVNSKGRRHRMQTAWSTAYSCPIISTYHINIFTSTCTIYQPVYPVL